MNFFFVRRMRDVQNNLKLLEDKLNLKIKIAGTKVQVDGDAVSEFDAEKVFSAINFGFSVKKSLPLIQEDFAFRTIHIKDHTKRNLRDIKARLIGTKGKTKRVLSRLSDCEIVVSEGEVGVVGDVEAVEDAVVAIVNLIKGSKQSNMYHYLERQNKRKKDFIEIKNKK